MEPEVKNLFFLEVPILPSNNPKYSRVLWPLAKYLIQYSSYSHLPSIEQSMCLISLKILHCCSEHFWN